MLIKTIKDYFIYNYKDNKLIVFNSTTLEFGVIDRNDLDLLETKILILKQKENHRPIDQYNRLHKVVMLLTTKCNMKCKYCYAGYGSYSNNDFVDTNMNFDTIDLIVKFLHKEYNKINYVQFFGGEPLLYLDGIEFFLKKFHKIYGNSYTKFGVVTNGTIINDKLDSLLSKYDLKLTVSLDGNRMINDQLRVFLKMERDHSIILSNSLILTKSI